MIDIHCHILNNVDDGACDISESINSLKLAEEAGFTDIILTPHYIKDYYENSIDNIKPVIKDLKQTVYSNNILVNLHHGNEIYINEDLVNFVQSGLASTLAKSRYVLFELPFNQTLFITNNVIDDLLQKGYIPVLAHPERYEFVQQDVNDLIKLIHKGVLIQSNYGSLLGQYGNESYKTLLHMLKCNMVHFLASDTHRHGNVYANFDKVLKILSKNITQEYIRDLTTNNAKYILNDWEFKAEEPVMMREKRNLFFF